MAEAAVAVLLGCWLAASILAYAPRIGPLVRRFDLLALIPQWKFFAPLPGRGDYHLLFRDHLADGSIADWTELPSPKRPWFAIVWNPLRRRRKAIFDVVNDLSAQVLQVELSPVEGSLPFLALLNYVSSLPRSVPARGVQFLLMYSETVALKTRTAPQVMFLSGVHQFGD